MRFFLLLSILSISVLAAERPPAKVLMNSELPQQKNFHIYLLMGQSNMAGRGKVDAASAPNNPRILAFNRDDRWIIASDPLHWDKPQVAGVGPGLAFAQAMAEGQPDISIGLIPCAVGGTPLSRWQKGGDLYEAAVKRARTAAAAGTLAGVLWHQGESDANEKSAPTYQERLGQMLSDLRADLGIKDLPIVIGELGEFHVARNGAPSQTINDALRAIAAAVPQVACVDAKGLKDGGDNLHFDAASQREFGQRYAKAMRALGAKPAKP